jgi:hypothetical protein
MGGGGRQRALGRCRVSTGAAAIARRLVFVNLWTVFKGG